MRTYRSAKPLSTGTAVLILSFGPVLINHANAADEPVDRIVVTATPLDRSTDELAIPVTVIGRDDIVRSGGANLGDLLGQTPGVSQSSFAQGASRPIIRGLDNFRVRLQENGIGSHDVSDLSEDHGAPIDPLAAQRIEVIRGPATLRYGSAAIGGIVHTHNNRIPTQTPSAPLTGELFGTYTSASDGFETAGLADFGTGPFAGHADVFYRTTDDYDIPHSPGTQANSDSESLGLSGGGSYLFSNGHIGGSVTYFESEYGIPGEEPAAEGVFIDLQQIKGSVSGEANNLGTFIETLRVSGGYSDYTHDEVVAADGIVGATFDNKEGEGRIEAVHKSIGPAEGAFGVQFTHRRLEGAGEASELISPAKRSSYAAFVFEDVTVTDALNLQLGARVEHVSTDGFGVTLPSFNGFVLGAEIDNFGADVSPGFTPISASAGLIYALPHNLQVSANVQYIERAPALLELFAKGGHEATRTFEIGNPNLGKEKAVSFDAGLKKTDGDVTFAFSAFYTDYDGFIYKNFTGLDCGEEFDTCGDPAEDELQQVAYTQDGARFYGMEAQAAWQAFDLAGGDVTLDARLDLVDAKLKDSGNVPRIPPLRYGAGVTYENGGLFSRLSVLQVTKQDDVAANENPTKGYTDLRAEASYTIPFGGADDRALTFGATGTNLLNQDQRNHVSFNHEEVLLPGASARLFIRVQF